MSFSFLSLGSNLGNKEENIARALKLLENKTIILQKSSLYKTKPVGYQDQPNFLNCVVKIKTALTPTELLVFLQEIEHRLGRVRTFKDGPRIIDLDILLYDNVIINTPSLLIPHPRLQERLFVLEPLAEIAPGWIHPIFKKKIKDLKEELLKAHTMQVLESYKNGQTKTKII